MNGVYLAGLLVGVLGTGVVDARWRLFLFHDPRRALIVLTAGVAGFLLWDAAGVGLGIFFEGNRSLLVGVDLAPDIPIEEVVFLVLLCLTTMVAFRGAGRLLERRGRTGPTGRDRAC